MEIGWSMLTSVLVILAWVAVLFVLMVGIALLVKVWRITPEQIKEVAYLKNLVRCANEGNINAQQECEGNFHIYEGVACKDGNFYRISQSSISRMCGF